MRRGQVLVPRRRSSLLSRKASEYICCFNCSCQLVLQRQLNLPGNHVYTREPKNGQVAQPSCSTNSSIPMKPPSCKGLKCKVCQVDNLVEEAMSVLKKPDDSCDSFGRYIATELRELNENQRVLAKQKISDIICQAQLNKLVDGQHHTVYKPDYYNSGYYTNSTPDYQPSPYQPSPSPSPSDCSDSDVSYTNM
ncbi:uncharacterized protein [Macrobrachium rosenbergii]|uniref:uncharacterized protein isoform X2 n=1 Tax=Macrobrachium rosenbergii TaxID=79674 RepID=UPI0034D77434